MNVTRARRTPVPRSGRDHRDHAGVVFVARKIKKLGHVVQARVDAPEGLDHRFETRAFTPQFLRPLGLVPDIGLLKLAIDLG